MDFNFFEPYLNAPKKSNFKTIIIVLLFIAAIALMAYYQYLLLDQSKTLQNEIAEIDAYIQSDAVVQQRETVLEKQNYEKALASTYASMKAVETQIESANAVETQLIEKINAEIPENVFLSNMQILKGAVSFTGFASDYKALSQFVYNVRGLEEVDTLSIPTVNELEENLSFSVNGILSEEGQDESQ